MQNTTITKDITIEELIEKVPDSVNYLMEQGIKCIACGEPIWGTLEEAAKEKNFSDDDIHRFVKEINKLNQQDKPDKKDTSDNKFTKKINKLDLD